MRPAGRREPDPLGVARGGCRQPLERDRKVSPALGRHQGVNLIHHDMLDAAPVVEPACLAQQEREALGRRDEHMGRLEPQLAPVVGRCVAGAHSDPNRASLAIQPAPDLFKRQFQIVFDVVAQAAQGRDVNAPQTGCEGSLLVLAEKPVQDCEECCECLPGSGRRDQEHVLATGDRRPGALLRRRWAFGKSACEPVAHRSRKQGQRLA